MLNVHDHSRESVGMKYIYPVVSRRSGGVSIGINLNTNNACNWACIYCQVPNLTRGTAPPVDLILLEEELRRFLQTATAGDFLEKNVPPEARRLVDVAFSGNGEPTSAGEFAEAVSVASRVLDDYKLLPRIKMRLITNGSLMHRAAVRRGIALIGSLSGEVWFKIDAGTTEEVLRINGTHTTPDKIRRAILACSALSPTWIQTCLFATDGQAIAEQEFAAYLGLISSVSTHIQGVHLYGMARPSLQPEANRLSALNAESLSMFAQRIAALGLTVVENP